MQFLPLGRCRKGFVHYAALPILPTRLCEERSNLPPIPRHHVISNEVRGEILFDKQGELCMMNKISPHPNSHNPPRFARNDMVVKTNGLKKKCGGLVRFLPLGRCRKGVIRMPTLTFFNRAVFVRNEAISRPFPPHPVISNEERGEILFDKQGELCMMNKISPHPNSHNPPRFVRNDMVVKTHGLKKKCGGFLHLPLGRCRKGFIRNVNPTSFTDPSLRGTKQFRTMLKHCINHKRDTCCYDRK
jgi:DNA-directed RNA polymerase subunit H (RpoH/RPB5)